MIKQRRVGTHEGLVVRGEVRVGFGGGMVEELRRSCEPEDECGGVHGRVKRERPGTTPRGYGT